MTRREEVNRYDARHPANPLLVWIIAFGIAAALYLLTSAPGLIWGDSGNAQLRVLLGHFFDRSDYSRSHITFYIICRGLSRLGADPARTATTVSALAGAVTVANTALLMAFFTKRRTAIICGATLLMCSHALWHLSTVAEVNTLSTALLSLELVLVVGFLRRRRGGLLAAALLVNGLGLATHNMSLLMWPAYFVLVVCASRARSPIPWRTLALSGGAFVVGASPLIALFVFLVRQDGDPAHVFGEMLTGRYAVHVYNSTVPLRLLLKTAAYTLYSFPSPLVALSVVGAVVFWRTVDRATVWFFAAALFVYAVFAIRYNVPDQHVFLLHSYIFLAVLTAMGVDWLCAKRASKALTAILIAIALPAPLIYAVTPTLLRQRFAEVSKKFLPKRELPFRDNARWFLQPWHFAYHGPEVFARVTLNALPPNAVLDVDSTPMPPLLYLQHTEKLRRDIQFVSGKLFQTWFAEPFDIEGDQRDRTIADERLFTLTPHRKIWNYRLRGAEFDVVPSHSVYRIVRVDDISSQPGR